MTQQFLCGINAHADRLCVRADVVAGMKTNKDRKYTEVAFDDTTNTLLATETIRFIDGPDAIRFLKGEKP